MRAPAARRRRGGASVGAESLRARLPSRMSPSVAHHRERHVSGVSRGGAPAGGNGAGGALRGGGGEGAASHRPSRAGKPQRAPWRSAGETHDSPRSTIHRRTDEGSGDAVTTRFCDDGGEGRRALVNSQEGRDTAGGDGATRSSRGTFFAAGSGGSRARTSAESALTDARHTTPPGDRFDARASIGARMACAWTREAAREPRSTRVGGMFLRRVPRRRKRRRGCAGDLAARGFRRARTCAFASPRVRAHTRRSRTFAIARAYPRARRVRAVRRGRSRSDS